MNCPTKDHCEGNPTWNQNPPTLAPELTTRQSLICGGKKDGRYDLPLHVLALFIILALSTLACSFPLMVKKFPQLRVPHHFLFLSRHFGTGVLISTAFVHLLPTAFTSLTDPCLPAFWNKGYPAMAGLIAMIAVFLVVTIEMTFSTLNGESLGGCHGGHAHSTSITSGSAYQPVGVVEDEMGGDNVGGDRRSVQLNGHVNGTVRDRTASEGSGDPVLASISNTRKSRHRRSGSIAHELRRIEQENISMELLPPGDGHLPTIKSDTSDSEPEDAVDEADHLINGSPMTTAPNTSMAPIHTPNTRRQRAYSNASRNSNASSGGNRSGRKVRLTDAQQQQKNLLQVLLLEAGILFHSVFIGMALSVATGSNFIVLLIAISFHQTFEGLALGSRIAGITAFPHGSPKPWLMTLAYGTTTPIGQAIGLFTYNMYDPASQTGLLMVGVMNAISSGLLLFAGLVELLAEDFLSDESYVVLKGRRRVQAGLSVLAGAAGMALVGAWA